MLMWNGIGVGALTVYYLITSGLFFWSLDRAGWFRVGPEDELTGLDEIKHKEKAYDFCKGNKNCVLPC